jgi:hypothetical protein
MELIKTQAYINDDGILRLELPTSLAHRHIDVLIVMQPIDDEALDEMGYPIGYFEETYGMFADSPIERGEQPPYEMRDELD